MVYLTGDTHGNFNKLLKKLSRLDAKKMTLSLYLAILG